MKKDNKMLGMDGASEEILAGVSADMNEIAVGKIEVDNCRLATMPNCDTTNLDKAIAFMEKNIRKHPKGV